MAQQKSPFKHPLSTPRYLGRNKMVSQLILASGRKLSQSVVDALFSLPLATLRRGYDAYSSMPSPGNAVFVIRLMVPSRF